MIDQSHKSHNTPVPYPTIHHSEQKCPDCQNNTFARQSSTPASRNCLYIMYHHKRFCTLRAMNVNIFVFRDFCSLILWSHSEMGNKAVPVLQFIDNITGTMYNKDLRECASQKRTFVCTNYLDLQMDAACSVSRKNDRLLERGREEASRGLILALRLLKTIITPWPAWRTRLNGC